VSTAKPAWIYEGFMAVQAIENVPHGLRLGLCTVETPVHVREQRDPGMANTLSRQGVDFVILDGVRGLGPEIDLAEVRANKPIARALKKTGIRRVLYTQTIGQIVHEPFFAELPEAAEWVQRGPDGQAPTFGPKWWQYIPCLNNPDFTAYVSRIIRDAMHELDLDGIFTDLYGYFSYTCACDHCRTRFQDYIDRKYPDPDQRMERFGSLAPFEPPPFRTLGYSDYMTGIPEPNVILDPVSQEWIRFRCERLGEVTRELNETVKACNPDAILYVNYLYGGVPGLNNAAFHGAWPELVLPECDLFSAEVAGKPELLPSGVAKSRVVQMKVAKSFDIPVTPAVTRTELGDFKRLFLAEGMAFNTSRFDWVGPIRRDSPPDWMRSYVEFSRTNHKLLGRAATVSDCAILHSFETLSYTCSYPHESTVLCEQSLLQEGITFDIAFDAHLEDLERYRCLFLPNVVSMKRDTAERIAEYVRNGGSLVASEDTCVLNERMQPWRGERYRREKSHLLGELLQIAWPETGTLFEEVGRGRVAIVARIERPWQATPGGGDTDSYRTLLTHSSGPPLPLMACARELAVNHADIVAALDYALDGRRTVRIDARGPIIPEVTRKANGLFVHLLNWDEDRPLSDIAVSVLIEGDDPPETVRLISPDKETPAQDLEHVVQDGRTEFRVPHLVCYNVIVIAS
jgi:hypothetical protein